MKKVYFYLLAIMIGLTLAACGHDDEPEEQPDEIQTEELEFYSRTIKGNNVAFLNSKGTIVLNYSKGTIQLTCKYNDFDGHAHKFTTGEMQVEYLDGSLYSFSDPTMQSSYDGSTAVGFLNMATGVVLFRFCNDFGEIVISTYLNFPAAQSRIQKVGDSYFITHNKSDILFAPIDQGSKCILQINNFVIDMSETVACESIQFLGLPMTPTPEGYIITADRAESTYGGNYTITDVNFVIRARLGLSIVGSFVCNGHKIEIAGNY